MLVALSMPTPQAEAEQIDVAAARKANAEAIARLRGVL